MKTHVNLSTTFCWFCSLLLIIAYCTAEVIPSTSNSINNINTINRKSIQKSSSSLSITETPNPSGFWKTRREWKAYWVKDWAVRKIYVPLWKRVWSPTEVKEWVPTGVAKPHPGLKHDTIIH